MPYVITTSTPWGNEKVSDLRAHLDQLRRRYDDGAVSPPIYAVIKQLEVDLGWFEFRGRL